MTQKKDRRSARTRKREQADRYALQLYDNLKIWVASPAFPRSHSSSAPMVPEASQ